MIIRVKDLNALWVVGVGWDWMVGIGRWLLSLVGMFEHSGWDGFYGDDEGCMFGMWRM